MVQEITHLVAGPPNHIETLMNHSGEIMLAAQQNMSGGQSMSLWNVFVAPFAAGLPYEKVKQAVQMFIYNLKHGIRCKGIAGSIHIHKP